MLALAEQFQNADAHRVPSVLKELRLQLVEGRTEGLRRSVGAPRPVSSASRSSPSLPAHLVPGSSRRCLQVWVRSDRRHGCRPHRGRGCCLGAGQGDLCALEGIGAEAVEDRDDGRGGVVPVPPRRHEQSAAGFSSTIPSAWWRPAVAEPRQDLPPGVGQPVLGAGGCDLYAHQGTAAPGAGTDTPLVEGEDVVLGHQVPPAATTAFWRARVSSASEERPSSSQ